MRSLDLAGAPLDAGEFEELPSRMAPAQCAGDRPRITIAAVEIVVTAIGISLKNAQSPAAERSIVADIGPEPGRLRAALCQ